MNAAISSDADLAALEGAAASPLGRSPGLPAPALH